MAARDAGRGLGSPRQGQPSLSAPALEPFVTGRQPYSHAIDLDDVDAAAPLLPPGAAAALTHDESGLRSRLSCGPGWTLFAMRRRGRTAVVRVCAETDALAREVLELATSTPKDAVSNDPAASIGFWHADPTRTGGIRAPRSVDVPDWLCIRRNYATDTAAALDRLMTLEPGDVTGRLILLHGPADTGKTTALRALAHSWRQWCQVECVLDPDVLFADSSYLMSVALGDSRPTPAPRRRPTGTRPGRNRGLPTATGTGAALAQRPPRHHQRRHPGRALPAARSAEQVEHSTRAALVGNYL